jgi:3-deoxy-manno-octulosonate cytidylyltransferase (CMP-KDO synthetase)
MREPVLAVVPARLGSSRLPRKPLVDLLGRPLLQWVWERLEPMEGVFDRVVVATDSPEILALCDKLGAHCVLTDPTHPSGTDRVFEVADRPEFRHFPLLLNIQGDEPLMEREHLTSAVELVASGGWDLGTCATPVGTHEALADPTVVKVARGADGRALYFSRAPIPHRRDGIPGPEELLGPPYLRHLGLYAYRREALARWVSLPPSPLEEIERLEQLRALEAGLSMGVAVVKEGAPGVDTAADVVRMEEVLSRLGNASTHTDLS